MAKIKFNSSTLVDRMGWYVRPAPWNRTLFATLRVSTTFASNSKDSFV
ncbi:MAG: hypothetical protein MUE45_01315 [Methanoregulaceae archaeon]|nr:hypothetical protein [Methanoregulaceae archaeon]MCU0628116.1 hypothetical protein [Methanoregulaceae archaeon]